MTSIEKRIGVLRGGPSIEHRVSLHSGQTVLEHLPDKIEGVDIFVDSRGRWHVEGEHISERKAFRRVDGIFNTLHGKYGEDGMLQELLNTFNIPYTGPGKLCAFQTSNKEKTKNLLRRLGYNTPAYLTGGKRSDGTYYFHSKEKDIEASDLSEAGHIIFRELPQPVVIKPLSGGSSLGVSVSATPTEITEALRKAFSFADLILIEQYIHGREVVCGIVDGFRGEERYCLLPSEVRKEKHSHHSFENRFREGGSFVERPLDKRGKKAIQEATRSIYNDFDLRNFATVDFVLTQAGSLYVLEIDSVPSLTEHSFIPHALTKVGSDMKKFVEHVIDSI